MGTFDLLHPGHLDLFKWCRQIAGDDGEVIVAVNSDEFTAKFKQPPTMTVAARVAMCESIKSVNRVIVNDGVDQLALITKQAPQVLVIGSDWGRKDYLGQLQVTFDDLDRIGVSLCYAARPLNWWSTTKIKQLVRADGALDDRHSD